MKKESKPFKAKNKKYEEKLKKEHVKLIPAEKDIIDLFDKYYDPMSMYLKSQGQLFTVDMLIEWLTGTDLGQFQKPNQKDLDKN